MKNKKTTPVSPPNTPVSRLVEDFGKALIKQTAANAQKLLSYSRDGGLSPQETLFSMVLCLAMLAHTIGLGRDSLHEGIDAALDDLNLVDEQEE